MIYTVKGLEFNGEALKSLQFKMRIYFGLKDHLAVDHHKCSSTLFSFTYVGLQFCRRGVQEQYELSPSQLICYPPDMTVYNEEVYYQYTKFILKNNQHRFKDANISNKQVRSYAFPGNRRCLVKLLDCNFVKITTKFIKSVYAPITSFSRSFEQAIVYHTMGWH